MYVERFFLFLFLFGKMHMETGLNLLVHMFYVSIHFKIVDYKDDVEKSTTRFLINLYLKCVSHRH